MDRDTRRARVLIEESREAVIVVDDSDTVLLASRRARQSIDGIDEGERVPDGLLSGDLGIVPLIVPYDLGGRRERIVYLSQAGDMTAYEELRTGFTAAVSHELRTPLARLLALLETATLPGEDVHALVDRARAEVESVRELIDEVLFLSELESGGRVVSLGPVPVRPELDIAAAELEERASRAGVDARGRGRRGHRARDAAADAARDRAEPGGERDPLRGARGDRSRSRSSARATRSCCAGPTTAWASTRTSCRGCSSASTGPTAPVPHAAPGSGSRS